MSGEADRSTVERRLGEDRYRIEAEGVRDKSRRAEPRLLRKPLDARVYRRRGVGFSFSTEPISKDSPHPAAVISAFAALVSSPSRR